MQRTGFFLLCVVALGLVVDAAQPQNNGLSSTFTQNDANTLKSFLQQKADKLENVKDAFYATHALAQLDTKPTAAKTTELCNLAKNTLKDSAVLSALDAERIYYAAAITQQLGCGASVEKGLTDALKTLLEDGDSVPHFYYAVSAALALRGATKGDIKDDDLTAVIDKVGDLTESDGTVRTSSSDKEGNLYNTGLALQLYAKLIANLKVSEQDNEHIDDLAGKVETILDLANEGENTLSFSSDDGIHSSLATTSEIVRGFQALSKALNKPVDVTPIQTAHIGEYFLSHRYASTLEDAYYLLNGLRAVQQSPKSPLALTLERSSILVTAKGAEGHIKTRLADIFDTPVAGKILLVKAHASGKVDAILSANQDVTESFNFLAAKPEQGFYVIEFRAVPTDSKYATIDSTTRRVKVIGSISVSDFELLVSDSREARSEGSSYKAEFPNKIEENIQIGGRQYIHAQFKVRNAGGSTTRPLIAQQAFLRFTHVATGHEAVFVATPNENKAYSVVISLDESSKLFRGLNGTYTVSIVVGDAFVQNPISWNVATVTVLGSSFTASSLPSTNTLGAKPKIAHIYREDAKRPPALISTAFTGLALAPLLFLLGGFAAVGANINKFPTGTEFFSAVGFVVSIGLTLLLIAVFWLSLNLIQTLTYLAALSIPTIFFGNRALSHLAKKEKTA